MRVCVLIVGISSLTWALPGRAGLITTVTDTTTVGATVDGSISPNEYGSGNSYSFSGGGSGFGGPVGSGTLYLNSDLNNLYIGATLNGGIGSNIVTIYLDTKTGGFDDSTMFDNGDSSRWVATDLTRDVNDVFPFQADYALQFGNGFTNFFELTGGSLNYIAPTSAGTGGNSGAGDREASVSLATIGITPGQKVDFFTTYISDTRFTSNEGIPAQPFSGGGNPGFGSAQVNWDNFDRFVTVPEPSTGVLMLLGGCAAVWVGARRRRDR